MILYHGSFVAVNQPDLVHSRKNVDFGKGFYVTPILNKQKNGVTDLNDVAKKALYHDISLMKNHVKI